MEALVSVTDMRQCDLCQIVKPMSAHWWFINQGRSQPSEWALPQHWCVECMQYLKEQHIP